MYFQEAVQRLYRTARVMSLRQVRQKTILISVLIGIAGAGGAIALFVGLEVASHFFQGSLMGIHAPAPAGETWELGEAASHGVQPWLIVALPALGGLLSGWLVYTFAPEAEGHGMDATIRAFHHQKGRIRTQVPFVKGLASILTIGTGGSGGREGPIAQIGGGIASWFAGLLHLSARERRVFMLAGTAAGIGAIFRAPLGGALATTEILYKEDFESSAIIPCVISSVTSYTLFRLFLACKFIGISAPTIYLFPEMRLRMPWDLGYFLVLAVFCALMGRIFVGVFEGLRMKVFPRLPIPRVLRPCFGGLLVGLVGLLSLEALGSGHGLLQKAIDTDIGGLGGGQLASLAASFLILASLKILVTSLSIGSGGSGGVFGPSLLIGGLAGAFVGTLLPALLPGVQVPPLAAFVVLGMASFFSGVASAPIGTVIMVSEMTGSYGLLAPLLLVCVVAMLINRRHGLYESQLHDRFESPVHQRLMVKDVLEEVTVSDYYHPAVMATVDYRTSADSLRQMLADDDVLFPLTVVDDQGVPCGILNMGTTRPVYFQEGGDGLFVVADMAEPMVMCYPNESLGQALQKFERTGYSRLPVLADGSDRDLIGYVQFQDVMQAYGEELTRQKLEI